MTTPQRGARIELDGTLNVRDLGGWPTADGGSTRFGLLYRSDRLSELTDADHQLLDQRGIVTVVDLRYHVERSADPSRLWSQVVNHREIPIGDDLAQQQSVVEQALSGELTGVTDEDVAASYVEMLSTHGGQLGLAVEALLAEGPGLFHCTAGKDRTGLLSMLILQTVGVAHDAILEDYLLTNEYRAKTRTEQLRPTFAAAGVDIEAFLPMLGAPRLAMETALAWVASEYETAARFLTEAGGVTDPEVRLTELLVEPAPS